MAGNARLSPSKINVNADVAGSGEMARNEVGLLAPDTVGSSLGTVVSLVPLASPSKLRDA
jgi:hypothetical protein